jgi:hypothetical protein
LAGESFLFDQKQDENSEVYMGMQKDYLFPFRSIHSSKFFLQDRAPSHTSKRLMAFLNEKEDEFTVMDWP